MTNRYLLRPFRVDAAQWTDTNAAELAALAGDRFMTIDPQDRVEDPEATAALRESNHDTWDLLTPGDWVIRRPDGRFFKLADEQFRDAYTPDDAVQRCPQHPDAFGYEHPDCGFHWHGRDGMDIPMRDGEPVCPRCEIKRMHERHKASLRRADEVNNELMEEVQRYAAGTERPVLWSVYNRVHLRALAAETVLKQAAALYERWVKAGAPPLGTPIARWWDARLIELRDAVMLPDQPAAAGASRPLTLATPCANPDCQHPYNWHKAGVCQADRCGCIAFAVDTQADEAQQQPETHTPCSDPPCNHDGSGEPCDTHETEQAHAAGEHEYCGVTCEVQMPSAPMYNAIIAHGIPGTAGMLEELLRRAAAGLIPSAEERQPGPDVVAYRNPDRPEVLVCRKHGERWWGLTPVTAEDLPDGGTCTHGMPFEDEVCGVDVLIPEEADRG